MIERLKNALRSEAVDRSATLRRRTTEILLDNGRSDAVSRAQTAEPALIMIEGDLPGQVFRLAPGRQIIGRRPECEIRVRERAVSGIHAEIIRERDYVTIADLASTNGTLVNGLRINNPVPLTQGSLLKLGNCVFKFVDSLLDVEFLESLHTRGITDQLTGAFNQSYLMARLGFALDTAGPTKPLSVIAFDFDDFKQVNDRFGHAAGDHILRASCALIRSVAVRQDDIFARMGGEEFVIVLPQTTREEALAMAERIRQTLAAHTFDWSGSEVRVTVSFGVCTSTSMSDKAEGLLARTDALLYESKRAGRNRVTG